MYVPGTKMAHKFVFVAKEASKHVNISSCSNGMGDKNLSNL